MDIDIPDQAPAIAVLLHPHPDMGGDRFNHVIGALYSRLPRAGFGVARFDFTSSELERAAAEALDAVDAVERVAPETAIAVVGYSFGALVAMRLADERIAGWFLVAPPIDHVRASALPTDARPKRLAVPERDFSPPDRVREATASWTATEVTVLADTDHFLATATAGLVDDVAAWLGELPGIHRR